MSKFNKFLTILCLSAFIFMVGCSKDDKPTPDPNNPNGNGDGSGSYGWEFLKVGNKWQYEVQSYDKYNKPIGSPYTYNSGEIIKIEKSPNYSNTDEITYKGDEICLFGCASDKGLYWTESDLENNFPFINKNYSAGQKWVYTYDDGDKITNEILSINETVKVPAGTFTGCVKIRETYSWNKKSYEDNYFSPKYGIIMRDKYNANVMKEGEIDVIVLIYKNF